MRGKLTPQRFLGLFLTVAFLLPMLTAALNYLVDPFFNYRKGEMSQYFSYDQRYAPRWKYGRTKQYRGYNAIWTGSSLSNYVDTAYLDENMSVKCCTGIVASGRLNLYEKLIRNTMEHNRLDYVFCEFQYGHWINPEGKLEYDLSYIPACMETDSILDDGEYLVNSVTTAQSLAELWRWTKGELLRPLSLWAAERFGSRTIEMEEIVDTMFAADTTYSVKTMAPRISANITRAYTPEVCARVEREALENFERYFLPLITENPETEFIFVVPPSGMMDMARIERGGQLDDYLAVVKTVTGRLLKYENVRVISSLLHAEFNMDCDNYMDSAHYRPEGAVMMMDDVILGREEITADNIDEMMERYRVMAKSFSWPFLEEDFEGEEVAQLQRSLQSLGYPLADTGVFDSETKEAVLAFQQRNGLEASGIAFEDTLRLIEEQSK